MHQFCCSINAKSYITVQCFGKHEYESFHTCTQGLKRDAMIMLVCKTTRGHMVNSGIPESPSLVHSCLVSGCQ